MDTVLTVLLGIAMLAVVVVLGAGIVGFMIGGEFNSKHASKLMRWRVGTQAAAVILLLALVLLKSFAE